MCGIVGVRDLKGAPVDGRLLEPMVDSIRHRGPDDRGIWSDGPVALGHARLSIIDLSGGAQPMSNPAGTLEIVFNGEIFNYRELREELVARGHRFATHSDTEVILHLYEERGEACVEAMNGQWAFAIWDARREKLFLSRDRVGIRPLYYTTAGDQLVFASEVKALFQHPAVERRIDPRTLDDVFTFWCSVPPRTIFAGVNELPPGHNLTAEKGRVDVRRYWALGYGPAASPRTDEDHVEGLRELLVDATRLRMRADVPVGAYLSGGLDSSATVAIIKTFTDTTLHTFSVAFEDPQFDESRFQDEVRRRLGTEHHVIRCSHEDVGRVFPDVVWHAESPLIRTAPSPLFLLSGLVRDAGLKVVVTGEGADEMLGGYDIFKEAKIRRFWARRLDSRLRPLLLKRLYPYMENLQRQSLAYLQAFFHVKPEELASPFFSHLPRWEMTAGLKRYYSKALRAELEGYDAYETARERLPGEYEKWDPFEQAQWLESTILMPGYILSSQGDRMGMGHSVEGRFPFLDHRVVEFAGSIPPHLKMKVLDEKHVLKRAVRDLVPEIVLQRPKQPYRAPDAVSLLGAPDGRGRPEWVDDLLAPKRLERSGLFNPLAVDKLVRKFQNGRALGVRDNMALVGIVSTELLMDQFIHAPRSRT
jgi:asparagine synthase (glutamine-hydrolysing)